MSTTTNHDETGSTRGIKPMTDERYKILKYLTEGTFSVPIKERTKEEKNAGLQYWRLKDMLSLEGGKLLYNGKAVVKKSEQDKLIDKEFTKSKGSGARSLYYKLNRHYSGVTELQVKKALFCSEKYQEVFPNFTNKPVMIPIDANDVAERWQIDLVDMQRDRISAHGKVYNYILSVIDVFSRFTILRALESKSSKCVARELDIIFSEHGTPSIIQTDQGTEFKGFVKKLLEENNIKTIQSRPYHPQSQGKCERSHRELRKKLNFCCRSKKGSSWVEDLHTVANVMNTTPKEVLAYQTPFFVYFNRNCSKGRTTNKSDHLSRAQESKNVVRKASKRCARRMIKSNLKKAPPSVYKTGETVFILFPNTGKKSRVPVRRYVKKAKIVKRHIRTARYKVAFASPNGAKQKKWINVNDITSLTQEKEKNRRKKAKVSFEQTLHKEKYYLPLSHSDRLGSLDVFGDRSIKIAFDPVGDGNCQFSSISDQMTNFGIHRSTEDLRTQAVGHLARHQEYYQDFVAEDFNSYIASMLNQTTYGDHLTLQALTREFNVQCLVLSANGRQYDRLVSNSNCYAEELPLLLLGYFPEGAGEHYVSLDIHTNHIKELLRPFVAILEHNLNLSTEESNDTVEKAGGSGNIKTVEEKTTSLADDSNDNLATSSDYIVEYLPREIQEKIVKICLKIDPSTRYVLERVNSFFHQVVNRIRPPQLYISHSMMPNVARPVSVRRLISVAGQGSGLVMEKRIIPNPHWVNAWLHLRELDHSWYEVMSIWWRNFRN